LLIEMDGTTVKNRQNNKLILTDMVTCKKRINKDYFKKFWNGIHLEEDEKEDSKLVDTRSNNWNEREGN
jgi:hypothetical protein